MNFKKLHIKILSIAFLVTLACYSGSENHILPQQFASGYVVFTDYDHDATSYSTFISHVEKSHSVIADFDRSRFLKTYNSDQKVVYSTYHFISQDLKKKRLMAKFSTEIFALRSIENRIII